MNLSSPVLIAGGGIGGLALALALGRRGISSRVLERRDLFSEAGAGIQLSPNAVRVLRLLGAADKLAAAAPSALIVRDGASGRVLQEFPLGAWIEQRHGAPYWVAHRRDLQAALLAAVEDQPAIEVVNGFDVCRYEVHGPLARVFAVDGRHAEGQALVGADGVFSEVRRQLSTSHAPHPSGLTAARALVPSAQVAPHIDVQSVGAWLAARHHVVHYPVRGGGDIAFVVVAPAVDMDRGWAIPLDRSELLASVAGFDASLISALEKAAEWRRWTLFELAPLARWTDGPVTILGDAAHPTLPFLAQGGGLALEDAVVLAQHLAESSDVPAALASYARARRRRTAQVVAAARQNGRIFHLSGLAAKARNAAMGMLPAERLMARYDWVYGWRPD